MPNWMRVGLQQLAESLLIYLDDTFEVNQSPDATFNTGERF